MSDFDRENEEVFTIVHNNPYRTGVKQTVGYIVPAEQAERLAAQEAVEKKSDVGGLIWLCLVALAITAAFVLRLA